MCQFGYSYEDYWGNCTEYKVGELPPCKKEILKIEKNIINNKEK